MKPKKASPTTLSMRTLSTYHESYLRELRKRKAETRGTYDRALREFFRWLIHEKRFVAQESSVERYKRHLIRRRKLSPVSVSTYLTALRLFCRFLVERGVLKENPAAAVKGSKRPATHSRETITAEQISLLLQCIDRIDERGFRDYAVLKGMSTCGLSEIELVRANVGDLRMVGSALVFFIQPKGSTVKDIAIILPPDVKEAFEGYLVFRKDSESDEPLFMSAGNRTRGKRMTTRGLRERVNLYLEKAGIKGGKVRRITPFSLRHSAATILAAQGASVEEIQARFRIRTTNTAKLYMSNNEDPITIESTQ
jgi:site-specific recombinase XerD